MKSIVKDNRGVKSMGKVNILEKLINLADKLLEYFAIFMIGCSVLLAFVSVILRYVFGVSYEILTEISVYTIVYGVFFIWDH